MPSPAQYFSLVRHMGVAWVWFRVRHAVRCRTGALRRSCPATTWDRVPSPELRLKPRVAPSPTMIGVGVLHEADQVLAGRFRLFSHREMEAGPHPDWQANRLAPESGVDRTGTRLRHWTEIRDWGEGDIKGVWELSRFSWAYALVRAWSRTRDEKYAETYWRLFSDWCAGNPPNTGANWMCGQEASFRLFAVVFAAEVLGVPNARRALLARFVTATGRRIAANLAYALSQKNNHGVSECTGLITAAMLVPAHPESADWLARGLRALETQLADLVYADGGFAQHSLIYHRVLLHNLCWVRQALDRHGESIPRWLDEAGKRSLGFLGQLVDPHTGGAPLYGANDGANVLPLSDAAFLDLRPAIQLASAVFSRKLVLPTGPWDEAASWLAPQAAAQPRQPWPWNDRAWQARDSGVAVLRAGGARCFFRCPERFRHRPSQADLLHVDVWRGGRAVAGDGGTFSYHPAERFAALCRAEHHNVLVVDGSEPMRKFSRFLYLPWPKGTMEKVPEGWRAAHNGYAGLGVRWQRTVTVDEVGLCTVHDRVRGAAGRRLRWHWRLAAVPWQEGEMELSSSLGRVRWQTDAGLETRLVQAASDSVWGWWSPHYSAVEPAVALLLETTGGDTVELTTQFLPPG